MTQKLIIILAISVACTACRGPAESRGPLKLRITPELLDHDWPEGPRREAAETQMRHQSQNFVRRLFAQEAMPTSMPPETRSKKSSDTPSVVRRPAPGPPTWSKGVAKPPRITDHDLPRPWPIQVRQGENIRVLARWAGCTRKKLLADNKETLGRRKWLRAGDRLTITMSANQKLAFDRSRTKRASERLDNFFATRYVAKVIVYRISRKERLADAIRRFGRVPTWLLQEFNQRSFRKLKVGDEVLIPVVKSYNRAHGLPPQLRVVDGDGESLQGKKLRAVQGRMSQDLLGRARLAIDDGNVFERGGRRPYAVSRVHLPNYGQLARRPTTPQAPAAAPKVSTTLRQVLVKRRETLGHYAKWSGLSVRAIVRANPGLNADRIFIGTRVQLPLGDDAYATFVLARANRGKKKRPVALRLRATPAPAGGQRVATGAPRGTTALTSGRKRARTITRPGQAIVGPGAEAKLKRRPATKPTAPAKTIKRVYHRVKSGDTASGIAVGCKTPLNAMKRLNPGKNLSRLRIGQKVRCK